MTGAVRANEEILALVGPWAKAEHPDKYKATLQQVSMPARFRAYLLRLVELRAEAEPKWVREVPVSILDETRVMRDLRDRATGRTFVVGGRRAGKTVQLRWTMLALEAADFQLITSAITALDLDVVQEAPTP